MFAPKLSKADTKLFERYRRYNSRLAAALSDQRYMRRRKSLLIGDAASASVWGVGSEESACRKAYEAFRSQTSFKLDYDIDAHAAAAGGVTCSTRSRALPLRSVDRWDAEYIIIKEYAMRL